MTLKKSLNIDTQNLMNTVEGHVYKRFHARKNHAKQNGIVFNITLEYVTSIVTDRCPILGIELTWCSKSKQVTDGSPSLDRIDPKKGYVENNVAWISNKANRIKNNGTSEEHDKIAKWMKKKIKYFVM